MAVGSLSRGATGSASGPLWPIVAGRHLGLGPFAQVRGLHRLVGRRLLLATGEPPMNMNSYDVITATGSATLALLLVTACTVCWAANLITLPGNWMAIALIAAYAVLGPQTGVVAVSWGTAAAAFALGLAGEAVEFLAAAAGAKRAGASRRSTFYAIVGSMIGAIGGAVVGVPIPIVGSILAAIIFGGLGATAGAMYGEWTDGRPWRENVRIGEAAFWGRTLGTIGKTTIGLLIVGWVTIAVLF